MTHPTNDERASYAATALNAFRDRIGYDDEDTSMLDLITDLGHLARSYELDFLRIVAKAVSTWAYERKHPDGAGPSPQVTITIEGRKPTLAWSARDMGGP